MSEESWADDDDALIDSFMDTLNAGQRPDPSAWLAARPGAAPGLKYLLAMLLGVKLQEDERDHAVSPQATDPLLLGGGSREWGDYLVCERVGGGGMGVVYEAIDTRLDRVVALKVLHGDIPGLARREQVLREARAAARLHHTNIVPVFEAREHDGVPYFTMQLIRGHSLAHVIHSEEGRVLGSKSTENGSGPSPKRRRWRSTDDATEATPRRADGSGGGAGDRPGVDSGRRLGERAVATIGVQVAGALAYAHQHGVLHRDVKPSNVLVDDADGVWLTDFGLALSGTPDASGEHGGSLRYMSPEQRAGRPEARSDVYSLGVTLYEMLALRPPFAATEGVPAHKNVDALPASLRSLIPKLSRDLEAIVSRAMAESPSERYGSASDLADDLRAFLDGRPVSARRVGSVERTYKWVRRHAWLAVFLATVQGLILVLTALGWWSYKTIRAEKERADAKTYVALLDETRMLRREHREGWLDRGLKNLGRLAASAPRSAERAVLRRETISCLLQFREVGSVPLAPAVGPRITSVAYAADGRTVALIDRDGSVRVADGVTGRVVRSDASPPTSEGVLDPSRTAEPVVRMGSTAGSVVFIGRRAGAFRLEGGSGPAAEFVSTPGEAPCDLSFDRAGRRMALAFPNGRVELRDAGDGRLTREFSTTVPASNAFLSAGLDPSAPFLQKVVARLSPDGTLLAVRSKALGVVLLFPTEGSGTPVTLQSDDPHGWSICFSPDGSRVATASMNQVHLWDVRGGKPILTLRGHNEEVTDLTFSPVDRLLASSGLDQTSVGLDHAVRIWDTGTGETKLVLRPRLGALHALAFSPDGRRLAVGGDDGATNIELSGDAVRRGLDQPGVTSFGLAFHPKDPVVACGTDTGEIVVNDARGSLTSRWKAHRDRPIYRLAFHPDGRSLASGPSTLPDLGRGSGTADEPAGVPPPTTVAVWSYRDRTMLRELKGLRGDVTTVGYSPSGRSLLAGSSDGTVIVWDAAGGVVRRAWSLEPGFWVVGPSAGFLDEDRIVVTTNGGLARVIRVNSGRVEFERKVARGVFRLAVSPDRRVLALSHYDGGVGLFSLPDLKPVAELEHVHVAAVPALAFSPDGLWLATGGLDGRVVLWDTRSRQLAYTFPSQENQVNDLAFDPTGGKLGVLDNQGNSQLWDLSRIAPELARLGLDRDPPDAGKAATTVQSPSDPIAWRGLGPIENITAPWMGFRVLESCLNVLPDQPQAVDDLAWLYLTGPRSHRDPEKARALAVEAVRLAPSSAYALNTRALAEYRLGRYDEAMATIKRARSVRGKDPSPYDYFLRAMCHARLGHLDDARTYHDRAVALRDLRARYDLGDPELRDSGEPSSPTSRLSLIDFLDLQKIEVESAGLLKHDGR